MSEEKATQLAGVEVESQKANVKVEGNLDQVPWWFYTAGRYLVSSGLE